MPTDDLRLYWDHLRVRTRVPNQENFFARLPGRLLKVSDPKLKLEHRFGNVTLGIGDGDFWLAAEVVGSPRPALVVFLYIVYDKCHCDLAVTKIIDFVCVVGDFDRWIGGVARFDKSSNKFFQVRRAGSGILSFGVG